MSFVNPLFLYGAALVALPIVLHLIMRQRPKRLEFPALRFIQKRHDVNRRRLMLRHILLLLLRAGAIALLAFALALPSVSFSGAIGTQEAPVAAALVFDVAPRMEYQHDNQSRLQAAREIGEWLLTQLPSRSEVAVLDTRLLGSGKPRDDLALARLRIERLQSALSTQSLTKAAAKALAALEESDLARKELYLFTDLSQAAWPSGSAAALQESIKKLGDVGIYIIDVGVENPANYALGALRLSSQVLSNRNTLTITTELSRAGPPGQCSVELYLLDNEGREQKRSEENFELGPGESRSVEFHVGSLGIGWQRGFVRIVGRDALAGDDQRFFTVEVRPAWRILLVAPKKAHTNPRFLAEALSPTVFRKLGQIQFDGQVIDQNELAQWPLEDYAVVCLLDPAPLEDQVWKRLADYAGDGRGVAIFLGGNAQPVDSFNTPVAQELLPGKLILQARTGGWDVGLAPRNYAHPILAEFRELADSIPWSVFPVLRYWQLGPLHADVGEVLPFADGRPALLERPVGDGLVLTMTTPVSDDPNRKPWNLLPINAASAEAWPFVILVHGMISYLVGSSDQPLNFVAGAPIELRLDPDRPHPIYKVFAPDGSSFSQPADLERNVLPVGSTDQVGNYRVRAGGEQGVDQGFSVNLAPQQTQLARITEEELGELLDPFPYRLARTKDQIERAQHRGRAGRELFPVLILAVALVLAMEHLVANRFYRE